MMLLEGIGVVALGMAVQVGATQDVVPRVPIAKRPLRSGVGPQRTVVKFVDGAKVRGRGAALRSESDSDLERLRTVVRSRRLVLRPLFTDDAAIASLTARAQARTGRGQPDLRGLFEVENASLEDAEALAALDVVEFVSRSSQLPPPPVDLDPPTPDLVEFQGYLGPDPGVDAMAAWRMGHRGQSVRLVDIEYAWLLDHEEWNEGTMEPEPGQTPNLEALEGIADGNHGTAVAGVLIAGDNGYGVTGIAPDARLGVYTEFSIEEGSRRAEAIISAASDSVVGDVILLEMQVGDNITGLLGPAELNDEVWMATRMATDAGLVVVATAGNGALDLDREELAYYRNRGDSGAIMVGAGRPGTRERLSFSTFGERLDVQGWGQGVFTTGYGQYEVFGDDPNQSYTATFAGTSSAGPVVAGVVALVQDAVKAAGRNPLSAEQMRVILRGTGLPQPEGDTGRVGPLPQAPAAIAAALAPPTDVPTVTIASPGSTQIEETSFETTIEIEASDNTARVQLLINGELQPVVDEVPPFAFDAVVFPAGTWEVAAVATTVWDVEATSEAVTLEVGWEPPAGSSTGDASTGVGAGTGGDTGDNTTGGGIEPTSGSAGEGSGTDTASGSGGGGGCRVGGAPSGLWLLGLLGLWGYFAKPRSRINALTSASRPRKAR